MIKIMLIAPYKELIDLTIETFEEHNVFESSLQSENSYDKYQLDTMLISDGRTRDLKVDADVIISRGKETAELLQISNQHIPIVEITLAGNDLIRSLFYHRRYNNSKIR